MLRKLAAGVLGRVRRLRLDRSRLQYGKYDVRFARDMSFSKAVATYPDRDSIYAYMHHYFYQYCTSPIVEHRNFFSTGGRGFGEDAFHAMWFLLLREIRPTYCLEIGVYRGQTISLWALIAGMLGYESQVHGISPFTPVGDSVSSYLSNLDYMADVLNSFQRYRLPQPFLVRGLSSDTAAVAHIARYKWDLIYIDGGHDYKTVSADFELAEQNLAENGVLVLDDSACETTYSPPTFAFAGHPGPSQVARERASGRMVVWGAVGHNTVFVRRDSKWALSREDEN